MKDSYKAIIFMLITTVFNVVLTLIFIAVFLFAFLKFVSPFLNPIAIEYGIVGVVLLSVLLEFIIYRHTLAFVSKKYDLEFLQKSLFKK